MILRRVSLQLISIIFNLLIFSTVSAPGSFTVDIYEIEREVIFQENEKSKTIEMDGVINYSGASASGDTIQLFSQSDMGDTFISPVQVTFQTTGSEEFTVTLIIDNNYENGTEGFLRVSGVLQTGGLNVETDDYANIKIINLSQIIDNDNHLNNSEGNQKNDSALEISSILIISVAIIIIIFIIFIKHKKLLK